MTNLIDVCPMNLSYSELSPQCIMCDFNTSCKYGMETNIMCSPRETVECEVGVKILFHSLPSLIPSPLTLKGNRTFNRSYICRFCYQLPEEMKCCEPNTTCNVRQSKLVNLSTGICSKTRQPWTSF